jgi:hypothetical protein
VSERTLLIGWSKRAGYDGEGHSLVAGSTHKYWTVQCGQIGMLCQTENGRDAE